MPRFKPRADGGYRIKPRGKFGLTAENYHSPEARARWLSSSDIKKAMRCEASWIGDEPEDEAKPAFVFGHLFEALVCRDYYNNPAVYSSRGPTKGQLKAEYSAAVDMARAVRRSPFLSGIIDRSKKQVVMTGNICGLPIRMMCDLLDTDGSIWDIKSAKSFLPEYDSDMCLRLDWWAYWHYPVQMWIYREIARQNGIAAPHVGLISAAKDNLDVQAIEFGHETMEAAEADAKFTLDSITAILRGEEPHMCGACKWCTSQKVITEFLEV